MNDFEHWYRPRTGIDGFLLARKEKIQEINELEIKDTLVFNSEEGVIYDSENNKTEKKKSEKKKSTKSKDGKTLNEPIPSKSTKISELTSLTSTLIEKKDVKKIPELGKKNDPIKEKNLNVIDEEKFSLSSAEHDKTYQNHELSRYNNGLNRFFKCPDSRCYLDFSSPQDLLLHISEMHSLSCKMPYCTFYCYTFQDYSEHFENVHCIAAPIPVKRGANTSLDNRSTKQPRLI